MYKYPLLFLAALVVTGWTSSALAEDVRTCIKAKDLKLGDVAVALTPNPATLTVVYGTFIAGPCEVSKLAQICMPSNFNGANAVNIPDAQCCFKMKCPIVDKATVGFTDNVAGSAFAGEAELGKPSTVCVPCIWSGGM